MIADNGHVVQPPQTCPFCGRPYPPYFDLRDLRLSGLLDMVVLAQDILTDLKTALEQEVLP